MVRRRGRPRRSWAWLRQRKYMEKWTHKTVPIRFKLLQPPMAASIETALIQLDYLEIQVFALLETLGVEESEWPYYMAAAKRMFAACKHFWFETWLEEVTHIIDEFVERGYDEATLQQIADIASEKCELARPDMPPIPPIYTPPPLYPQPPAGFSQAAVASFQNSYNRKMVTLGTRVWIFYTVAGEVYVASADLYELNWTVEKIYSLSDFPNYSASEPTVWQQGDQVGIILETHDGTKFWKLYIRFRCGTLNPNSPFISWNIPWTDVFFDFLVQYLTAGHLAVAKTKTWWWVSFQQYGSWAGTPQPSVWYLYRSNDGGLTWSQVFARTAPSIEKHRYRYMTVFLLPDGDGTADDNLDIWYGYSTGWTMDYYYWHEFYDGATLYPAVLIAPQFDYDPPGPFKYDKWSACKDNLNRTWILKLHHYSLPPHYVQVECWQRLVGSNVSLAYPVWTLETQVGWGIPWRDFSICYSWGDQDKIYCIYSHDTDGSIKLRTIKAPFTTWTEETLEGAGAVKTGTNLIYYPYTDWLIPVCYAEAARIMYGTIYSPEW